jgi:hypothetical protein
MTKSNIYYYVPKTEEVRYLEEQNLTEREKFIQDKIDSSYGAEREA